MAEERPRPRRRRRRRGGSGGGAAAPEAPAEEARPAPELPDWQWRTFPVLFTAAVGLLIGLVVAFIPGLNTVAFFAALGGVAYGLAHIVTRRVFGRRRR